MLLASVPATSTEPAAVISWPTSWDEVTLGQFLQMANGAADAIVVLASDPVRLRRLPDTAVDQAVAPYLKYLLVVPDFSTLPVPDEVTVLITANSPPVERTVRRPTEIGMETYGQKMTVQEELRRLKDSDTYNYIDAAEVLLSVYLYPALTGRVFDDITDTIPIIDAIRAIPCTVALPIAAFFLTKSNALTPSGRVSYRLASQATQRLRWWQRLGRWCLNWVSTKATNRRTSSPNTGR